MHDELTKRAADMAMLAVANYLRVHGVDVSTIDYTRATTILKEELRDALPQALADAKEAIEARMPEAASATFAASMRLAGIRAGERIKG